MDSKTSMQSLLHGRKPGYSLAQPFYNDPGFHAQDMEHIWQKSWIFAALTCDIPASGDFVTLSIGDTPVLILRDENGAVQALYNTCRHRGSKLCLKEKGNTPKLVCPYHQWTYNLDGSLLYAGHMDAGFDRDAYPLKRPHCRIIGGYIFICLAEEAPDFDSFQHDVEPYLLPHDIDNCKVAFESSIVEKANWKLVIENNRECYHCAGSHPELLNTLAEFDNSDDPRIDPAYATLMEQKARNWDAQGLPHRPTPKNLQYRAVRLPFINDAQSMTIDGSPASNRLLGQIRDRGLGSVRMLSLPNTWNHLQADHVLAFRVLPLGPQETLVTTKWLVHKDAEEGRDYDLEKLTKVWLATNDQDRKLAEDNQQGINSIAYEPGPYSATIEFGVINFIDWYCETMQSRLQKTDGNLQEVA